MTLPGLVAELRREVVSDDPQTSAQAVRRPGPAAPHEGVPGADPAQLVGPARRQRRPSAARRRGARCASRRRRSSRFGRVRAAVALQRLRRRRALAWARPTSAPSCTTSPPSSATPTRRPCGPRSSAVGPARAAPGLGLRPEAPRGPRHGRLARAHTSTGRRSRAGRASAPSSTCEVALGRAVVSGTRRPPRAARRRLAARHRLKTGRRAASRARTTSPSHGQLGAYQLAVERGRLRRARRPHQAARRCCRSARAPTSATSRCRSSARCTPTTTRSGPNASSRRRPRAWPGPRSPPPSAPGATSAR